jgi:hypothetical protein
MNSKLKYMRNERQLHGRYANYVEIGHNAFEFILDFGQVYPEEDVDTQFHTRIIVNPVYAKSLLEVLKRSIEKYEEAFEPPPQSVQ